MGKSASRRDVPGCCSTARDITLRFVRSEANLLLHEDMSSARRSHHRADVVQEPRVPAAR